MNHVLRAGILGLAMTALLGLPSVTEAREPGISAAGQAIAVPALDVGRIERALKLTPQQRAHWPSVKSALNGLSRSTGAAGPGATIAALQRLAVAAQPLLAVLTEEQKAAARGLAAEMGLGGVVVAALR
jgi:hypothetical protein